MIDVLPIRQILSNNKTEQIIDQGALEAITFSKTN
ncbi:hypothetical protein SAMN05421761_11719 [Belliella pelovolcani]|uniref:Uncharacterized protein n=1 Tax=Belliella pelovolcani TaxID=529505 RepID=A0A1N7PK95_9BACT|nr:hypothetical protein SAMN05421761_11719 [Belliella pelovolcani]